MDMSSSMAKMVFTTNHNSALWSSSWTPTSNGSYAGTCIFLVVLGISSRLVAFYRSALERNWHARAVNRRYVRVAAEVDREQQDPTERVDEDEKLVLGTLTARGVDERVRVVSRRLEGAVSQPWRLSVDLPRAALFTVQAGVQYLLMTAVMTMNVGYFLSVLAGLFVGQLASGRFTSQSYYE